MDEHGAHRPFAFVKSVVLGMQRARSFGLAAEMAFWLFLSLVPLLAVAGLVAARFALARSDLLDQALSTTPGGVRDLLGGQLDRVAHWNGGTVAPIAAVTFVWLASAGVHSIFEGLEVQVGVARPWWKKRLLAIVACVVLSAGIAVIALLASGASWLFDLAGAHLPSALRAVETGAGRLVRIVLGALISFGLICGIYAIGIPAAARKKMPLAPGALLAVAIHALIGIGYGLYLSKMGMGDAYQAGLAVIGVTLMTLYFFFVALLAGAELNQVLGERRRTKREERARAGQPASAVV